MIRCIGKNGDSDLIFANRGDSDSIFANRGDSDLIHCTKGDSDSIFANRGDSDSIFVKKVTVIRYLPTEVTVNVIFHQGDGGTTKSDSESK